MGTKLFTLMLALSIFLSACMTPNEVVLPPDDYDTIANGGAPVYVTLEQDPTALEVILQTITEKTMGCPLYDGAENQAIIEYFDLPNDTVIQICNTNQDIQMASFGIAMVLTLPATIEPTMVGEATQGSVIAGGKVVGWVFVKTSLTVAITSVLIGDIVTDALVSSPAVSYGAVVAADVPSDVARRIPGPLGDLDGIPEDAIRHLERAGHHAWTAHQTTDCAIQMIRNLPHNQVYFSAGSSKQTQPSLAYVWYYNKAYQDMLANGTLGVCSSLENIKDQLRREFGSSYVDDLMQYRLVVSVGYDQGFFVFSAYPVKEEVFFITMCSWGYKWRIYPSFKPNHACL